MPGGAQPSVPGLCRALQAAESLPRRRMQCRNCGLMGPYPNPALLSRPRQAQYFIVRDAVGCSGIQYDLEAQDDMVLAYSFLSRLFRLSHICPLSLSEAAEPGPPCGFHAHPCSPGQHRLQPVLVYGIRHGFCTHDIFRTSSMDTVPQRDAHDDHHVWSNFALVHGTASGGLLPRTRMPSRR